MANLSALRNRIISQIPAANDVMIDRVLIEVIREFCKYTRAWRTTVTETVTANTLEVTLTPPTDAEFVDVVKASLDGYPLTKKTHTQLDEIEPRWRTDVSSPSYVTEGDELNEILAVPQSGTTRTDLLVVRVAWKPTLLATTINDRLLSQYSEEIINGTLHKMFAMPGVPWADGPRSAFYGTLYTDQRDDAKTMATAGGQTGVVRKVKYGGL